MVTAPFSTFVLPAGRDDFALLTIKRPQDLNLKTLRIEIYRSISSFNIALQNFLTESLVLFCLVLPHQLPLTHFPQQLRTDIHRKSLFFLPICSLQLLILYLLSLLYILFPHLPPACFSKMHQEDSQYFRYRSSPRLSTYSKETSLRLLLQQWQLSASVEHELLIWPSRLLFPALPRSRRKSACSRSPKSQLNLLGWNHDVLLPLLWCSRPRNARSHPKSEPIWRRICSLETFDNLSCYGRTFTCTDLSCLPQDVTSLLELSNVQISKNMPLTALQNGANAETLPLLFPSFLLKLR